MRTRRHKLYAVVTNDIYELPCLIGTALECAAYMGVNLASFKTILSKQQSGKLKGNCVRYKAVALDMLEEIMSDYTLAAGDTIKCNTRYEVMRLMNELKSEGYKVTSENKVITILAGGEQDGSVKKS